MKKQFLIGGVVALSILFSGCKDQFSDLNNDPTKPGGEIPYLFTGALLKMNEKDYDIWFNNSNDLQLWSQVTASRSGNSDKLNKSERLVEEYLNMIKVKTQVEAIKFKLSEMNPKEALVYQHLNAMCSPMMIYLAISSTDTYGSFSYSEAGKAKFTNPSIFTPKYETQEELFDIWLTELDQAIETLSKPVIDPETGKEVPQFSINKQDFVYGGRAEKWLKFANSLKLKIAVRMLHQDKARAIKIAEEVAKKPVMDGLTDDFLWNPGSLYTNTGNGMAVNAASIQVVDFMVKNKDPRVRFLYTKNDFNEEIAAAFIENGKPLPSYIDKYVEYTTNASGKKVFAGWKAPGEPWVRYHGVPVDIQANEDPTLVKEYYDAEQFKLRLTTEDGKTVEKSYVPVSKFQEELLRGTVDYNYPALPTSSPKIDDIDQPQTMAYMSTAEVNLYLAEFKLLGANLPQNADAYFKKGVEMSIRLYDKLANINKIPYYAESTGLATDATIDLKDGEIEELLAQPDYQLTGTVSDQLERVYIQEYLHFIYFPNDLFSTVRRSGVPKKGSAYYPYLAWNSKNSSYIIPRRKMVNSIDPTDQMGPIKQAAYEAEGFTAGSNDPIVLAKERVWYDKGAPEFGAGPNY